LSSGHHPTAWDRPQSFGKLAASAVAGLLWTAVSPRVAFGYLVAWILLALVGHLVAGRQRG
jgi:hypothetical protein